MKKIAVIPNTTKDKNYVQTKKLVGFLLGKAEIVMPKSDEKSGIDAKYTDDLFSGTDAVIILGGDGTMIRVAEQCGKSNIPVMGINMGKIGFMTEVELADMEAATKRLLRDDYKIESRMMMEITVFDGSSKTQKYIALNDTVISKPESQMIATNLYEDGEKVSEYLSDGLIVSTPTGSTGYSLSAGGPVADPTMNLFIATPMCAHQLASRPMLLSDKKEIEIELTDGGCDSATVTVDGQDKCKIGIGDRVVIEKSEYVLKIIKLGKQSFYYTMMAKL